MATKTVSDERALTREHGLPEKSDTTVNVEDAFQRGRHDASRDRPRLFRSTRAHGIVSNIDDPLSDEWSTVARQAYLDGYDSV